MRRLSAPSAFDTEMFMDGQAQLLGDSYRRRLSDREYSFAAIDRPVFHPEFGCCWRSSRGHAVCPRIRETSYLLGMNVTSLPASRTMSAARWKCLERRRKKQDQRSYRRRRAMSGLRSRRTLWKNAKVSRPGKNHRARSPLRRELAAEALGTHNRSERRRVGQLRCCARPGSNVPMRCWPSQMTTVPNMLAAVRAKAEGCAHWRLP